MHVSEKVQLALVRWRFPAIFLITNVPRRNNANWLVKEPSYVDLDNQSTDYPGNTRVKFPLTSNHHCIICTTQPFGLISNHGLSFVETSPKKIPPSNSASSQASPSTLPWYLAVHKPSSNISLQNGGQRPLPQSNFNWSVNHHKIGVLPCL